MLSLSILAALLLGWCTGGRLARFERCGLRLLPLPALALLLQRISCAPWALLLSYGLLFLFVLYNRHLKKTAFFLGLGSACNLAVIAANHWRMPVSPQVVDLLSSQAAADLLAGNIPMYAVAGEGTRLLILGDILYCPLPVLGGFASIGDLLLMLGVFFGILAAMAPHRLPGWMSRG